MGNYWNWIIDSIFLEEKLSNMDLPRNVETDMFYNKTDMVSTRTLCWLQQEHEKLTYGSQTLFILEPEVAATKVEKLKYLSSIEKISTTPNRVCHHFLTSHLRCAWSCLVLKHLRRCAWHALISCISQSENILLSQMYAIP